MTRYPPRCAAEYPTGGRCYNFARVSLLYCHPHRYLEENEQSEMSEDEKPSGLIIWMALAVVVAVVIGAALLL